MPPVNLALGRYQLNHQPSPKPLGLLDPSFRAVNNPIRVLGLAAGDFIIPDLPPIDNQGQIGSCAAHAGAGALEILLSGEGAMTKLSRLHLYWIARALDGSTAEDAGTFLRSICQQLGKIGVCPEELWPYVEGNFNLAPPLEAEIRASANRIAGYYRIETTGEQRLKDVEAAIRASHPVIFGTQVGNRFMQTSGKTPIAPDENDLQGGHATCLVGVQTTAGRLSFRDRNSWDDTWGDQGYAWLDQDYITWNNTDDIWVLTRMQPLR